MTSHNFTVYQVQGLRHTFFNNYYDQTQPYHSVGAICGQAAYWSVADRAEHVVNEPVYSQYDPFANRPILDDLIAREYANCLLCLERHALLQREVLYDKSRR
jgi:hypothetical protein